jgi:transglutaminase-like putative cysteine protease
MIAATEIKEVGRSNLDCPSIQPFQRATDCFTCSFADHEKTEKRVVFSRGFLDREKRFYFALVRTYQFSPREVYRASSLAIRKRQSQRKSFYESSILLFSRERARHLRKTSRGNIHHVPPAAKIIDHLALRRRTLFYPVRST